MSEQPEPRYQTDPDHDRMFLELFGVDGKLLASVPVAAPLNKNAAAPVSVQVSVAHQDGCARTLGSWPIPPY